MSFFLKEKVSKKCWRLYITEPFVIFQDARELLATTEEGNSQPVRT